MHFSSVVLTTYVDVDSSPEDDERILALAVEQALEFGRHGIHPWTTEHHFRGPWQSNPLGFMAHVAQQAPPGTYVGFGVLSVPFYHPVRLVEDMNLLDQMTKGHAVFGLGSGFAGDVDVPAFGLEPAHHVSGRAARESIDVMERLWAFKTGDEPFEFDTGVYRGRIEKRVVPAPYRRERPTIIRTASSEQATLVAAERGWPIFLGTMGMDLADQWQTYRAVLAAAGHPAETVEQCLRWSTVDWLSVLVADTDEQAEAGAAQAKAERLAERERFFEKYRRGILGPVADVLTSDAFRGGADLSSTIAGSPETVAARVQELVDLGINHLIVRFLGEWPGRTRELLERSLELFAEQVAPRFTGIGPLVDPLAIEIATERVAER